MLLHVELSWSFASLVPAAEFLETGLFSCVTATSTVSEASEVEVTILTSVCGGDFLVGELGGMVGDMSR